MSFTANDSLKAYMIPMICGFCGCCITLCAFSFLTFTVNAQVGDPTLDAPAKVINYGNIDARLLKELREKVEADQYRDSTQIISPEAFAGDKETLRHVDVLRRLNGRLHKDNALDAMIKLHLLAMSEPLPSQAPRHLLYRVVTRAPEYVDWPIVPIKNEAPAGDQKERPYLFIGTQQTYVSSVEAVVANSPSGVDPTVTYRPITSVLSTGALIVAGDAGVKIPRKHVADLQTQLDQYHKNIKVVNQKNNMIAQYRKALFNKLPASSPARLLMAAEDTLDSMKVGRAAWSESYMNLLIEAASHRDSDLQVLPEPDRRRVLGLARQIVRMKAMVIDEVKVSDGGVVTIVEREIQAEEGPSRNLIRDLSHGLGS